MQYIQRTKNRCMIAQLFGALLLLVCVFIRYTNFCGITDSSSDVMHGHWPRALNAGFNGLASYLFLTSIILIFLPVFLGKLSIIRDIFASNFFRPLARLNFSVAVIQGLTLYMVFFTQVQIMYFDNKTMLFLYFSLILTTYFFSAICALLFEYPFRTLVKIVICPEKKIRRLKKDLAKHLKSSDHLTGEESESSEEDYIKQTDGSK